MVFLLALESCAQHFSLCNIGGRQGTAGELPVRD
jgi:hypothetical protein